MRHFRGVLAVFLFLFVLVEMCYAKVELTIADASFVRRAGEPTSEVVEFTGTRGQAILNLYSGAKDSEAERVSSSKILINGVQVVGSSNFNQTISSLKIPIYLVNGKNRLSVTLFGKLGSKIRVQVTQSLEADGAAVIGSQGGSISAMTPNLPYTAQVDIPKDALQSERMVTVSILTDTNFSSPIPPGFTFIGGIAIGFGGAAAALPVKVTLFNTQVPPSNQVIVASATSDINHDGDNDWSLVEIAGVSNGTITTMSPPFPGISSGGSYAFLAPTTPLAFVSLTNILGPTGPVPDGIASSSVLNQITAPIINGGTVLPIPAGESFERLAVAVQDTARSRFGIRIEHNFGPAQEGEIKAISDVISATLSEDELMERIENYLVVKLENEDPGDEFGEALLNGYKQAIQNNIDAARAQLEQSCKIWKSDTINLAVNEVGQLEAELESLYGIIPWKDGGLEFVSRSDNITYTLPVERVSEYLGRLSESLLQVRKLFEGVLGRTLEPAPQVIQIVEARIEGFKLLELYSLAVQVVGGNVNPNLSVTYGVDGVVATVSSTQVGYTELGAKVEAKFGAAINFRIESDYSSCDGPTFRPDLTFDPQAAINIAKPARVNFGETPALFDIQVMSMPTSGTPCGESTSDPLTCGSFPAGQPGELHFSSLIYPREGVVINGYTDWCSFPVEVVLDGLSHHYSCYGESSPQLVISPSDDWLHIQFWLGGLFEGDHTIVVRMRLADGTIAAEKTVNFTVVKGPLVLTIGQDKVFRIFDHAYAYGSCAVSSDGQHASAYCDTPYTLADAEVGAKLRVDAGPGEGYSCAEANLTYVLDYGLMLGFESGTSGSAMACFSVPNWTGESAVACLDTANGNFGEPGGTIELTRRVLFCGGPDQYPYIMSAHIFTQLDWVEVAGFSSASVTLREMRVSF
ncbi:MAG: hypothetical protein A4E65_03095 [Syntrophorhabdus sp. PtaU1.Bin153]|nr:MAG: hypothetical protein A4E65_03095 [Syntrophorhabdus sp. PtaU1.Bin153]